MLKIKPLNMKFTKRTILGISLLTIAAVICTSCENSVDKSSITTKNDSITNDKTLYVEDFSQFNSHEDLVARFGEKEVVKGERYIEEGTVKVLVSIVFPESNHPLTVFWKEGQKLYKDIQSVEVSKMIYDKEFNIHLAEDDYWKFKNGLKIGMTIQELQKLNGGVFKFFGLGWDYGGSVFAENKIFENYSMILGYVTEDDSKMPKSYYDINGDMELKSDNKIANELPLKLVSIEYHFVK